MRKASIGRLLAKAEAEIPSITTTEKRWSFLVKFFANVSADLAETAFLAAVGQGEDMVESAHESILLSMLDVTAQTLAELGIDDIRLTAQAYKAAGDAFHARFMQLARSGQGSTLQ